jgi:hypothetical protein
MNAQRDEMLFQLEQRLARVGRKISAEFGASGKVWSKTELVTAISQEPASERRLEDFRVRELSASVWLATYRTGSSLRSSIWRRAGDSWQMIFHQGTALLILLAIAAFGVIPLNAQAQTEAPALSCTSGPYRLKLPKSYKALRGIGTLRRERVQNNGDMTQRELRFNGLELVVLSPSDKLNEYAVLSAVVSSANWKIAGPLRVGTSARIALKGLRPKELPSEGELEFTGEKDSVRVTLSRGRILDFEYSCSNG